MALGVNAALLTIALAVAENVARLLIVRVKAARAKANVALHTTVPAEVANAVLHMNVQVKVARAKANAALHTIAQENNHAYNIVTPINCSKI